MAILIDVHTATPHVETATDPAQPDGASTVLTIEDIHRLLPHRYPFSLVDRIIKYVPEKLAIGIKNVTFNEPHFQGHFPGRPIMPGVLIVEAMAQVGGIVLSQMPEFPSNGLFMFVGIDKVRFRRPVVPGDQLVMQVELLSVRRRFGKMQGRAEVDGQLAAEGELMFSVADM